MNYVIGIIIVGCGLFVMLYFPQKTKVDYVTKREVKFEHEGTELRMNIPQDKYIERIEILYHDKKFSIPESKVIKYYKKRLYKNGENLEDIIKRGNDGK